MDQGALPGVGATVKPSVTQPQDGVGVLLVSQDLGVGKVISFIPKPIFNTSYFILQSVMMDFMDQGAS